MFERSRRQEFNDKRNTNSLMQKGSAVEMHEFFCSLNMLFFLGDVNKNLRKKSTAYIGGACFKNLTSIRKLLFIFFLFGIIHRVNRYFSDLEFILDLPKVLFVQLEDDIIFFRSNREPMLLFLHKQEWNYNQAK